MKKIILSLLLIALPIQAEWISQVYSTLNEHKTLIIGGLFAGFGLGGLYVGGINDGYWKSKPRTEEWNLLVNSNGQYVSLPMNIQGRSSYKGNVPYAFFDQDECNKRNKILIGSGVSLGAGICLFGWQLLKNK